MDHEGRRRTGPRPRHRATANHAAMLAALNEVVRPCAELLLAASLNASVYISMKVPMSAKIHRSAVKIPSTIDPAVAPLLTGPL